MRADSYFYLKVGSGSGYLCGVLHHLVSPEGDEKQGKVVGIDHIPQLVDMSIANLRKDGLKVNGDADSKILMVCGDGRKGSQGVKVDTADTRSSSIWIIL